MHRALLSAARHAVKPFWTHAALPATADELAQYCPCSIAQAYNRLVSGLDALPPVMSMYYDEAPFYLTVWHNRTTLDRTMQDLGPEELEDALDAGWLSETVTETPSQKHMSYYNKMGILTYRPLLAEEGNENIFQDRNGVDHYGKRGPPALFPEDWSRHEEEIGVLEEENGVLEEENGV
jgi:hypothetical protein